MRTNNILLLISVWCFFFYTSGHARVFTFTMHHRFSDPVKKWSSETGAGNLSPADRWPEKGSFEYYAALADRDRFLRGRKLSDVDDDDDDAPLSFSDGNSTFRISSLGLYVSFRFLEIKFMSSIDLALHLELVLFFFFVFLMILQFALYHSSIGDTRSEVYGGAWYRKWPVLGTVWLYQMCCYWYHRFCFSMIFCSCSVLAVKCFFVACSFLFQLYVTPFVK